MLYRHRHFLIRLIGLTALLTLHTHNHVIAAPKPASKTATLKLTPSPSKRLQELLKRTSNDAVYDDAAMRELFHLSASAYDFRARLNLPASQGVPICVNFIERSLNSKGKGKRFSPEYQWALNYSFAALQLYGKQARPAVPTILRFMKTSGIEGGGIGFDAMLMIAPDEPQLRPYILQNLTGGQIEQVQKTVNALTRSGSKAAYAVPTLLKMLKPVNDWDEVGDEASYAYEALGAITRDKYKLSVTGASQLLPRIKSLPPEKSAAVFATLIKARKASAPAANALALVLKSQPVNHIRYAALRAIQAGRQGARPAVLQQVLIQSGSPKDNYTVVQSTATDVVFNVVSPKTPAAIPILIKSLNSRTFGERQAAVLGLGNLKKSGKSAIPAIVSSLKSRMKLHDYVTLNLYIETLKALGPSTPAVTDSVYEMMGPKSPYVEKSELGYDREEFRTDWLRLLMAVGMPTDPKKREFVVSQILIVLKKDTNPVAGEKFGTAAEAARVMNAPPAQLVKPLIDILEVLDEKPWFSSNLAPGNPPERVPQNPEIVYGYREVLRALGHFGKSAQSAAPVVRKYSQMRWDATMWEVKPDAVAALKKIEGKLAR